MQKTVRKFASHEELKDEEYRYWHSVSASERILAGYEMSVEGYRQDGHPADGRGLRQLLSAFNANRAKYVVVGGYAVFVHEFSLMETFRRVTFQPKHLIVNKLASGRPQDLADVAAIRQRQRSTPISEPE